MASTTQFIAVVAIAILASSAIAAGISEMIPGPEGPQGEQGPLGILSPDFDSGWIAIPDTSTGADILTVEYNLGTEDIFVYMIGKDSWGFTHQGAYGDRMDVGDRDVGAYWVADEDMIDVWRCQSDNYGSPRWIEVRLCIWRLPEP